MKKILIIFFIGITSFSFGQSIEKIIGKHLERLGGKNRLLKLTGTIEKRNIHLEQAGVSIESIVAIDKKKGVKTELKASSVSGESTEVFNLKDAYKIEKGKVSKTSRKRAKYLANIVSDFPSPLLKGSFTLLKKDKYNGVDCFVIKRSDGNIYWIKNHDYTLAKSETNLYHEELGLVTITSVFSNYKKVNGILFPFEREIIEYQQRITTESIELNPKLEKSFFEVSSDKTKKTSKIKKKAILPSPDKIPQEVFNKTKSYFAATESMSTLEAMYKEDRLLKNFYYDLYSTNLAIAGRYKKALEARDLASNYTRSSKKTVNLDQFKPYKAINEITTLGDQHQAIFINEAHHVPQHRAFTHQLLQKLYNKGFRYFAAETLMPKDTGIIQQKERMLSYINEPEYADLIRTAITIGYKIIPYEQENPKMVTLSDSQKAQRQSIIERETAQAQNLKERIFDIDPKAKVLVHAGYDHIMEKEHFGLDMMAKCFKELTGIDPLTIDQVGLMEKGNFKFSDPNYQHIINKINPEEYLVLKNKSKEYWVTEDKKGKVDIQLIHPRTNYKNQRPLWKSLNGKRKHITITSPKMVKKGIAEVFVSDEKNGVPIDRIYLNKKRPSLNFYLPKGKFILVITNEKGKTTYKRSIHVK